MTNVNVPYGESAADTATLLLASAQELELPADVVLTTSDGSFSVPEEVAKKAKVDYDKDESDEDEAEDEPKKPAKKAAKKATAKKTAKKA